MLLVKEMNVGIDQTGNQNHSFGVQTIRDITISLSAEHVYNSSIPYMDGSITNDLFPLRHGNNRTVLNEKIHIQRVSLYGIVRTEDLAVSTDAAIRLLDPQYNIFSRSLHFSVLQGDRQNSLTCPE